LETLAERIARDGPVSELDAIGWAIRLAKRLEALHSLGVAHGSVSPACVIAAGQDRNARAYLVDVQHTTPSPAYQSPERLLGGDISAADDGWALAATLYALLTGQSPFSAGTDAEIRQKTLAAAPPPLAVFDVGDDDLQHILDHAFSRDVAQRTVGVAAFRRALEEWHPDRGVANLPPLEDDDSTSDDDDGARTMIAHEGALFAPGSPVSMGPRAAPNPGPASRGPLHRPAPAPAVPVARPAPAAQAAPIPRLDQDDDDEDNARTVMRDMPNLAAMIARADARVAASTGAGAGAGAAAHAGAPAAARVPAPAAGPPRPAFGSIPRPQQAPPPIADDDSEEDDARTMMRTPEQMSAETEPSAHDGRQQQGAPMPAAERPAAWDAPVSAGTMALPLGFQPASPGFAGPPPETLLGAHGTQKIPPQGIFIPGAAGGMFGATPQPLAAGTGTEPFHDGAASGPIPGAPPEPMGMAPVDPQPLMKPEGPQPRSSKKGLVLAALIALLLAAAVTFALLKIKGI
jgi:hypothetical protein